MTDLLVRSCCKVAAVYRAKQYEEKLATFSVFNDALQKENTKLREQLEASEVPQTATDQEVQELKLEFARRMASVERDNARLKVILAGLTRSFFVVPYNI